MQSVGQKLLLSLVILMAATGFANAFDFDSGPTYASIDASETLYEFFSTIITLIPQTTCPLAPFSISGIKQEWFFDILHIPHQIA